VSPILEFDNIIRPYKKGMPVLNGVSFSMAEGEVVGLLGPQRRLRYARRGFRAWVATAPMFAAFFFILAPFPSFAGGYFFNAMLLRFSGVLPDSLWMLALMTAALTAGLCWLAEKVWRENEFGQIEIQVRTLQAQAV
jgi:hypothetical protein